MCLIFSKFEITNTWKFDKTIIFPETRSTLGEFASQIKLERITLAKNNNNEKTEKV